MKAVKAFLPLLAALLFLAGCSQPRDKTADPAKDLSVSHEKWENSDPQNLFKGTPLNVLSFKVTNSSSAKTYRRIEVTIDYLSKEGKRLDSENLMVIKTIKPGETIDVDNLQGKLANPLTDKALVSVVKATEIE